MLSRVDCRRGLYPKGGGSLEVLVHPMQQVPGFSVLERGRVTGVGGVAWACGGGRDKVYRRACHAGWKRLEAYLGQFHVLFISMEVLKCLMLVN
jgi:RNA 3'-terminal phosphate cyclase